MVDQHWVLVADSMDYDDCDTILGVFGTREVAVYAHANYVADAIASHPSNTALLGHDYSICCWQGREEVERWEKQGSQDWRRDLPQG